MAKKPKKEDRPDTPENRDGIEYAESLAYFLGMDEMESAEIPKNGDEPDTSVDTCSWDSAAVAVGIQELPAHEPELTAPATNQGTDDEDDQSTVVIPAVLPESLYVVTRQGIALKRDPKYIREMAEKMHEQGMNRFVIFQKNRAVLVVVLDNNGSIKPMAYPDPAKITTTPPQLYAKAITYAKIITRMVKRHLKKNEDSFVKTSKMIWVIALSVITLMIIFMLVVVAMDNFGSGSDTDTGTNKQQIVPVNPSGQSPNLQISPEPTQSVTQQTDPRVYVPPAGVQQ